MRIPLAIDLLSAAIRSGEADSRYDLNGDGRVGADDRIYWVETLVGTWFGDTNLDGEFDSGDLVEATSRDRETRWAWPCQNPAISGFGRSVYSY